MNRGDRNLSVSSHLTPDPEKRLGRMLAGIENHRRTADFRLAVMSVVCAVELIPAALAGGTAGGVAGVLLCAALAASAAGLSPFAEFAGKSGVFGETAGKPPDNYLVNEQDIVKYSHSELVDFLDRYLGGGVSATPYYEDIVSRVSSVSLITLRKRRILAAAFGVFLTAQVFTAAAVLSAF